MHGNSQKAHYLSTSHRSSATGDLPAGGAHVWGATGQAGSADCPPVAPTCGAPPVKQVQPTAQRIPSFSSRSRSSRWWQQWWCWAPVLASAAVPEVSTSADEMMPVEMIRRIDITTFPWSGLLFLRRRRRLLTRSRPRSKAKVAGVQELHMSAS
jgi:hypothetical protein